MQKAEDPASFTFSVDPFPSVSLISADENDDLDTLVRRFLDESFGHDSFGLHTVQKIVFDEVNLLETGFFVCRDSDRPFFQSPCLHTTVYGKRGDERLMQILPDRFYQEAARLQIALADSVYIFVEGNWLIRESEFCIFDCYCPLS